MEAGHLHDLQCHAETGEQMITVYTCTCMYELCMCIYYVLYVSAVPTQTGDVQPDVGYSAATVNR